MHHTQQQIHSIISLVEQFDRLPIVFLGLLVLFTRIAVSYLHFSERPLVRANLAAWLLVPPYLVRHFQLGHLDLPGDALPVILRGALGATLVAIALGIVFSFIERIWLSHRQRVESRKWRREQEAAKRAWAAAERVEPPAPRPIPRDEKRRQGLADIQSDYDQELAMIDEAKLDRRHRHFARQDAKRRYLRRLRTLMES